jgi:hypothetical protein
MPDKADCRLKVGSLLRAVWVLVLKTIRLTKYGSPFIMFFYKTSADSSLPEGKKLF